MKWQISPLHTVNGLAMEALQSTARWSKRSRGRWIREDFQCVWCLNPSFGSWIMLDHLTSNNMQSTPRFLQKLHSQTRFFRETTAGFSMFFFRTCRSIGGQIPTGFTVAKQDTYTFRLWGPAPFLDVSPAKRTTGPRLVRRKGQVQEIRQISTRHR